MCIRDRSYNLYKNIDINIYFGLHQKYTDEWLNINTEFEQFSFGKHGIIWDYSSVGIKNFIFSLMISGANFEECGELDVLENAERVKIPQEVIEDSPEVQFYNKLKAGGTLRESEVLYGFNLIKHAFEVYDYLVALNIGILCLEKEIAFSEEQLGELHTLLGLATHNVQFSSSQGNQETNDYIEFNNLKALEYLAPNDIQRAFIYYRLSVLFARRKGELDEGMIWAEKCIEFCKKNNQDLAIYCGAWAYNIRAYIFYRRKEKEAALMDMKLVIKQMDDLRKRHPLSRDINFSYAVFNDNLSALQADLGDFYGVLECFKNSSLVDGYQNWNIAMSSALWIKLHKIFLRLDLAIQDAELGANAAIEVTRPTHYNLYIKQLCALNFQLGAMDNCFKYIKKTNSFLREFKDHRRYALDIAEWA